MEKFYEDPEREFTHLLVFAGVAPITRTKSTKASTTITNTNTSKSDSSSSCSSSSNNSTTFLRYGNSSLNGASSGRGGSSEGGDVGFASRNALLAAAATHLNSRHRADLSHEMTGELKARLAKIFEPHNRLLDELLGFKTGY